MLLGEQVSQWLHIKESKGFNEPNFFNDLSVN